MNEGFEEAKKAQIKAELGVKLFYGRGVERDLDKAKEFLDNVFHECVEGHYCLGLLFWRDKEYDRALGALTQAAIKGHAAAQVRLATYFASGISGIVPDDKLAFKWCMMAAEQKYDEGEYYVARCLWDGDGCDKNEDIAMIWMERAARQGLRAALMDVAEWYGRWAVSGKCKGCSDICDVYLFNCFYWALAAMFSTQKKEYYYPADVLLCKVMMKVNNPQMCFKVMRKIAKERKVPAAFLNLGKMFEYGFGVAMNENSALHMYKAAGSGGVGIACESAARIFDERKDVKSARKWRELGAKLGFDLDQSAIEMEFYTKNEIVSSP